MRIERVELHRLTLPLVRPFRTSAGTVTERPVLLVRVVGTAAEGWGECAALAEPTYTSEYVDGAADVLVRHLVPRLLAAGPDVDAGSVGVRLAAVRGHPMAKAALETALLDAALRTEGTSLAARLGAASDRVPAGAAIGIPDDVAHLLALLDEAVAAGYRRVKLKIAPGWDHAPLAAAREHLGDDVELAADANGSYRLADSDHLAGLDALGLRLLEQPLPADDLAGHAALARSLRTPICLDESIGSARQAAEALRLEACAVVSVKPGRVGGLLEAVRIHDACRAAGASALVGGMLETGVGRAAAVALAALPGFDVTGDLAASDRYFSPDLTVPFRLDGGSLAVPDGPGIGVTPVAERLAGASVVVASET